MGSSSFPKIFCILCSSPVDLRVDLCADENGKAVHEECYIKKITSSHGAGEPSQNWSSARAGLRLS